MGVSKNPGIPKWMVYNGKPYFLMDDLGVKFLNPNIIQIFTRWWQLKDFLFSPPNPGEMMKFDEHIVPNEWKPPTSISWNVSGIWIYIYISREI